jgi:hypothetical protein
MTTFAPVWRVQRTGLAHLHQLGVQTDRDDHVSDDQGSEHAEVRLSFADGTWGWYPVAEIQIANEVS